MAERGGFEPPCNPFVLLQSTLAYQFRCRHCTSQPGHAYPDPLSDAGHMPDTRRRIAGGSTPAAAPRIPDTWSSGDQLRGDHPQHCGNFARCPPHLWVAVR